MSTTTTPDLAAASDYVRAWHATRRWRAMTGDCSYPPSEDVDSTTPSRTTYDWLPSVALRYLTVESFLNELGRPPLLISLLDHCETSTVASFRHPRLRTIRREVRANGLKKLLAAFRRRLAERIVSGPLDMGVAA